MADREILAMDARAIAKLLSTKLLSLMEEELVSLSEGKTTLVTFPTISFKIDVHLLKKAIKEELNRRELNANKT